ncbi:MAG: radical SAM protein [Victivallaceae bacterium]|nr:radical SAM protein [Victivallaceae bacterium]
MTRLEFSGEAPRSYIFGPVPSRRLGRSLGIDLVPFKTCSYDCIYCQLGRTTNKTVARREWVPLEAVLAELKEKLDTKPDYITLGGSGEPTLYSRLDELIAAIHAVTAVPVAVLTNGSLLWQEELRAQLMGAQLIIPSLDAGDAAGFEAVNRPHPDISFERMAEGLKLLRTEFKGEYWLEVFVAGGYTGIAAQVRKIARQAAEIKPDRVQLNTVTRPPAEACAHAVSFDKLTEFARLFNPAAEVIADFRGVHSAPEFKAARENVLQMLQRRPCTIADIAGGLGIHRNEAVKHVEKLLADKVIERLDLFYRKRER